MKLIKIKKNFSIIFTIIFSIILSYFFSNTEVAEAKNVIPPQTIACVDVIELHGDFFKYFCLNCTPYRASSYSGSSICTRN